MFLRNPFTAMAKRLSALSGAPVIPAAMARLVAATVELQAKAFENASPVDPGDLPADVSTRFDVGLPLIQRGLFPLDEAAAVVLARKVLDVCGQSGGDLGQAAKDILSALADDAALAGLCRTYLQGEDAMAQLGLPAHPKVPRLPHFVAACAVAPGVRRTAAALVERQPLPASWEHGSCPVCGSMPLAAHLEGKEGQRHLTCSLCATSYRVARLSCPVCLERDSEKLPYLSAPELPGFRLDACETCNHYVKTTDFREMDRKSVPEVDDLESMALDALAAQRGLRRASFCAWGF